MTMNRCACVLLCLVGVSTFGQTGGEYTTSAANPAELEALYTAAIERRTTDILEDLKLEDAAKAAQVHDVIVNQYRALRARDAVIDGYLRATSGEAPDSDSLRKERDALSEKITKPLHKLYVETLSALLAPEQVELVKDGMTYNKVKVTFDAYCEIIPNLTEADKALILKELKAAREEAIDGGSAGEKHAIFEVYKQTINAQLKANGHDVEKAFEIWEAKEELAAKAEHSPAAGSD
jgi:hypothetical protein